MEIGQLRYFEAVAEELHFRKAAERLHIAQPALSRQIQALEEELSVKLLDRNKRGVRLTDAGESFLQELRLVFVQMDRAAMAARRHGSQKESTLSIAFAPDADLCVLPTVIARFARQFPETRLTLSQLGVDEQVQALRSRRINLGFLRLPLEDKELVVEPVLNEALMAALPHNHALAASTSIALGALASLPLIFFSRTSSPEYYDLLIGSFRRAGFSPTITNHASTVLMRLGLVALGAGITVVPASVGSLGMIRGVVYREIRSPQIRVDIGAVYKNEDQSEELAALLGIIREVAASESKTSGRPISRTPRRTRKRG